MTTEVEIQVVDGSERMRREHQWLAEMRRLGADHPRVIAELKNWEETCRR